MLTSIAWPEFFTGMLVAVVLYYCVVTLLLYADEITGRVRSWWMKPLAESPAPVSKGSILGAAVPENARTIRTSTENAEDLRFDTDEPGEPITPPQVRTNTQAHAVAELLEHITVVFEQASESGATPAEIESLLVTLLSRHGTLRDTSYQVVATAFIKETSLKFPGLAMSEEQAGSLWLSSETKTGTHT
jgi:hypothetical protein